MKEFETILRCSNRKIVIHETCCYDYAQIVDALQKNDILFLDDCLHSQYDFLAKHANDLKRKQVNCVIGFSASIFRPNGMLPLHDAHCAEFHDRVHAGDASAYAAYMSIDELKQLLACSNVFLACHGDQHLDLRLCEDKLKQSASFRKDVTTATLKLKELGLCTSVFVYPYAYDQILLAGKVLRSLGYRHAFAGHGSQRIAFESLLAGEIDYE